jgi:pyruvate kinase
MRKTKIIATYGPSLNGKLNTVVDKIDILRINFSHNNEQTWNEMKDEIRSAIKKSGRDIKLLADLPGPKVRVGLLKTGVVITKGEEVCFEYGAAEGSGAIPINYENLYCDAKKGAVIIIGDGEPRLKIDKVFGKRIICKALESGTIGSKKGLWLSGAHMTIQNPTEADLRLGAFAKKEGFDYIAISFVTSGAQIKELRKVIGKTPLIAKVEQELGVKNIDDIAKNSEIVMVARGDLGLDFPIEKVPEAQRKIAEAAKRNGKPFAIATQVLTSMINSPFPTRAEVNDIATGVLSGASYIMLSEETTLGKYPMKALEVLDLVICETEKQQS